SLTQALKLRPGYPDATRNLSALDAATQKTTGALKPAPTTTTGAAQQATKGKTAGKSGGSTSKTPLKAASTAKSKKAITNKKPAKPKSKISTGVEKSKIAAT